jgi:type I restriction enzyme S subunit
MSSDTALATRLLGDPDVAALTLGQSPPSSTYNTDRRGLPFYQGKIDFGLLAPTPRVWCDGPLRIAEPQDTLISVRAPVGAVNIAIERCVLGRGLAAARPSSTTNPWFLMFAVAAARHQLVAASGGTTFESVNKTALENLEIPYPSRIEQDGIAAILLNLLKSLDRENRLAAFSGELKQSAGQQVFTRGLRGEPQRETEIGLLPQSWHVESLERHVHRAQYGLSMKGERQGQYPILRMNCQLDGRVVFRDLQHVDLDEESFRNFRLGKNDLLFNRTNSYELVGRMALYESDRDAVFASYLIRLTVDDRTLLPQFVNYYFNLAATQDRLRVLASRGVSQANISASKLKQFSVPVPPSLDEQHEIVSILEAIDRKITLHERKRATLQELFDTLLHDLMTGRLRVDDLDMTSLEDGDGTLSRRRVRQAASTLNAREIERLAIRPDG